MITNALRLIMLLGVVSFFADVTYEGARSITGQYLALLGASATAVGAIAGFGELFGYGLRLISGPLTDKTKRYWTFAFLGYGINMAAMPLLAMASSVPMAALLIILERTGKAIRTPSRDAMISYGAKQVGTGLGFGLHAVMDQSGAMLGPLLIALVYVWKGSYQLGFALLAVPAVLAMLALIMARQMFPQPRDLEVKLQKVGKKGFGSRFWLYMLAMALVAAGYVDFALIAYHLKKAGHVPQVWIPLLYSGAMGAMALSGLGLGRLYDIYGVRILLFATCASLFFAPLVFWGATFFVIAGMLLWGLGMGAQAGVMRAVIADITGADLRGTAYGIFNVIFGIAWFSGSALMGWLYDLSPSYLILFSCFFQGLSLPLLLFLIAQGTKASS